MVGFAIVSVIVMALAFTYPFSAESPEPDFHTANPETYSTTGTVSIEGGMELDHESTVLDDEAHIKRSGREGARTTEQYYRNGTLYSKYVVDPQEKDWFNHQKDQDREIHYSEREETQLVLITEEDSQRPPTHIGSHVVGYLRMGYYEVDTENSDGEYTTYRPQNAWIEHDYSYRITDAIGSVKVDSETGTVSTASVEFDLTEASSYVGYLRNDSVAMQFEYTLHPEPAIDQLEPPEWIEACVYAKECPAFTQ